MPAKRLIVNADDFGWSTGVNDGILEACKRGIVTSATLLVNFPAFEHAARLAGATPQLGLGLHLNIVHGPPVSDPARIPSLVTPAGVFPGTPTVLRRLFLGGLRRAELDVELQAQLARFRARLGEPTHLDSHKHLHAFGTLRDATVALGRHLQTPRLRCPLEYPAAGRGNALGRVKAMLLRPGARRLRELAAREGVRLPDAFLGLAASGALSPAALVAMLGRLAPGTTELMCHPGHPSPDADAVVRHVAIAAARAAELRAVTDETVRAFASQHDIALIHFGHL